MNRLSPDPAEPSVVKTPQSVVESQCRTKLNNSNVNPADRLLGGIRGRSRALQGMLGGGWESVFGGFSIGVVTGVRIEHCRVQALGVLRCIQKALNRHVAVEHAGKSVGRHNALDETIVVVNFLLQISLLVLRVAPGKGFFYGQLSLSVEIKGDALVLVIDQRYLKCGLLGCYRVSFVKQRNLWIRGPFPQHHVE